MKKMTKLFKTLLCVGLLMGGMTIVPATSAKANEIVPYASFIDVTVNKDKIIKKVSVGSGPIENIFFTITGSYRYSSSGPSLSNVKISVKFRNNESTSFTDDNQVYMGRYQCSILNWSYSATSSGMEIKIIVLAKDMNTNGTKQITYTVNV